VRYSPASDKPFSIVLIFQDNCVFRVDFVDKSICHINPLSAVSAGLPPLVCGPHCHTWDANRVHLLGGGDWELRLREPLAQQIRKFEQAFAWFAQQVWRLWAFKSAYLDGFSARFQAARELNLCHAGTSARREPRL
jgi:hypothetical protein